MNVQQALDLACQRFQQAEIPEARLDAEYLVSESAGVPRLRLALEQAKALSADAEQRLRRWMQERLERRPLAYILGEQPFMNLRLRVEPSVLIPRPETELLVERAEQFLNDRSAACVIDVGTGSGNIALSLAPHPRVAQIHAIDVSPAALSLAQENERLQAAALPVQWHLGDLLAPALAQGLKADLIVANLPYVRSDEIAALSPEVRCEPILALDGGPDGLLLIRELIAQSVRVLKDGGKLLLEIGAEQGDAVLEILSSQKLWAGSRLLEDLSGLPRIVESEKGIPVGSLND